MILREEKKKKKRKEKKEKPVKVRKEKEEELLREIIVKIELERIDTQERVMVEILLDSRAIGLVMSSEFAKKLKKIERPIYKKYR